MKFKIIRDFDQFLKLHQPWNELVTQCEIDHAFMKHEWFECWIENLGNPRSLAITTAWLDGQLLGVAPFQVSREKFKGLPARVLGFLSSGISPRCNFIMHDSIDSEDFFDYIFETRDWDLIITKDIDANLKTTQTYLKYLDSNGKIKYSTETGRVSPFMQTESGWDDYWKTLSKSLRSNLKRRMNGLKKMESYESIKITGYDDFAKIIDQLVETSAKSWKGKIGTDLKSTPELLSFYIDFSRKASKVGLFELWILKINDQIAAFDYYLKGKNSLSLIRTDFDPVFAFYSPGNVLKLSILKEIFERNGIWEYDMGGQAVNYKTKWANRLREHLIITAGNSSLYGNFLMFGKTKILPFIKKLRSKHEGNSI